jgi:hypothetical protein
MNFLFRDTISPITSCIGFLEIDFESAVNAYEEWMTPILKEYGFRLERDEICENLQDTLLKLQPLVSPIRTKFLFIPTSNNRTAFFDNGWQGTDASTPIQILSERLNCQGLVVTAVPHTMPSKIKNDTKGRYGATIMEVYGPDGNYIRTIYSSNDGGKWVFGESGDPFEFEDLTHYKARKIRDRFTPEILEKYLKELSIEAFNETFYLPDTSNASIMLTKKGAFPASYKEYTLHEVREKMGES